MFVKISPLLICPLALLLSACSGSASAPDSTEDAKISAEVDKILRDYQTGSDTSPQANASRYLTQIQKAIFAKIDQPASRQGQTCSVRLTLQRDGTGESNGREWRSGAMRGGDVRAETSHNPASARRKNLSNIQSCRSGLQALTDLCGILSQRPFGPCFIVRTQCARRNYSAALPASPSAGRRWCKPDLHQTDCRSRSSG